MNNESDVIYYFHWSEIVIIFYGIGNSSLANIYKHAETKKESCYIVEKKRTPTACNIHFTLIISRSKKAISFVRFMNVLLHVCKCVTRINLLMWNFPLWKGIIIF